jgi:hypothetical protein
MSLPTPEEFNFMLSSVARDDAYDAFPQFLTGRALLLLHFFQRLSEFCGHVKTQVLQNFLFGLDVRIQACCFNTQ